VSQGCERQEEEEEEEEEEVPVPRALGETRRCGGGGVFNL
jgi:hypothetical protein